jgi:flagellar basal body-associated protein FliL
MPLMCESIGENLRSRTRSIFIPAFVVVTFLLATGAFYMAWNLQTRYMESSPNIDGYVAPRSVADLVSETQDSTVTVHCLRDKKRDWIGSG